MSESLITFFASFLVWILLFAIIFFWLFSNHVTTKTLILVVISGALAWLISEVVKGSFDTFRPYQNYGLEPLTLTIPQDNSFPSTHSSIVFAVSSSLFFKNRKLGLLFIFGAILVGLGRVLAHVHYPLDIFIGFMIGVTTAYLLNILTKKFKINT